MHQMTRSNIIQVKKNKTIDWLPETELENVVDLAVRRKSREKKSRSDERNRDQRREKIKKAETSWGLRFCSYT